MSAEETAVPGMEDSVQEYDLGGQRSTATHYYHLQTEVATHSSKGDLKSTDIFQERLICSRATAPPGRPTSLPARDSPCTERMARKSRSPR